MCPSPEKFTLAQRKKIIYASFVLGFVLLFAGYIVVSVRSADSAAQQLLADWINVAQVQIKGFIKFKAKDFRLLLHEYKSSRLQDETQIYPLLAKLEESYSGERFYVINKTGMMFSSDNRQVGKRISASVLQHSDLNGIAITTLINETTKQQDIAEIIPLFQGAKQYLVRVTDGNEFASSLLSAMTLPGSYFGIFDASNSLLAERIKMTRHGSRFASIQDIIHAGIPTFLMKNLDYEIKQISVWPDFSVYITVADNDGWILGAYIPSSQLLPFFADMLSTSMIIFAVVFLLLVIVIILDIINDREKQRQIHTISYLDLLTGLLNALGIQQALKEFLSRRKGVGNSLACLDIVTFHRFNAMFGYAAGDKLLRVVAETLKANYRLAGRVSGDVFVCVAPTAPDTIKVMNGRLSEAIKTDMGREFLQTISFKFGIYPIAKETNSFGEVYDGGMLALKNAKKLSKQIGVTYDTDLHKQAELNKKIEINMLHALSKDEYHVYVQPKYDVKNKICAGGEALVRWKSEELGLIAPNNFIPLFEKNGFIVELDFYMLSCIFEQLQHDLEKGITPLVISVNQSKTTITFPNYLDRLKNLIRQYNVPLNYIEIEITESFLADDYAAVVSLMYALKELGFTIAMDDFGSGYSSLNTLRELPVDALKIDKDFLSESDNSERSRKIIKNVINMSIDLGVSVICEGVETKQQFDFLSQSGCNLIQGYYYARPIPLDEYLQKYVYTNNGTMN